jgi:phosphate:Na+ symporter
MKFSIFDILTLIGSLGLFIYGMKLMSEALQKVAGDKMRSILSAMTSNRFKGILTGFLITAVIQSSSATTVMIVSFVNAGLLSLIESIGVIMGANIGTTVTAWLISILGFKIDISIIALPLVALGFPLFLSKNNNRKSWGELVVGFSILFIGLSFLKNSVPDIKSNPNILEFLSSYTESGFWSVLLFLGIGTILTMIIQSSSAVMALTLVMCYNGWISFEMAAAMVLGENVGTTITANVAAIVTNVSAKRTARAHLIFNIVGIIWVLLIFHQFLDIVNWLTIKIGGGQSPYESATIIPIGLSIFHTIFNVFNTLFLVGFTKLIVKTVEFMVPLKEEEKEIFRIKYINTGLLSTSELSIIQAKKEVANFSKHTTKMFSIVRNYFSEIDNKKNDKFFEKIKKYEDISDNIEIEIATYLTKVAEGDLSKTGSENIKDMLKQIDNIESIADSCFNIARTINRKKQLKIWFTQDIRDTLNKMFDLIDKSLSIMDNNLSNEYNARSFNKAISIEKRINNYRDKLKQEHINNIEKGKYKYRAGIIYNDIFSECEKLGDFVINVSEAIYI